MNIPTTIKCKGEILDKLDFPPINCVLYEPYNRAGEKYIIIDIVHNVADPYKPTRDIEVILASEFKKLKPEFAEKEKTVSIKKPKDYNIKKENAERFLIQKRERLIQKAGKWGNWLNFRDYDNKTERDNDFQGFLKEQTPALQYRVHEKFLKGVNLTEDQKAEKNKGEGIYQILFREFDNVAKKLSGIKLYKRFKTPEERFSYFQNMPKEERAGKIFKLKTGKEVE